MPTREAMRSLTDEITGSYETRIADVAQIRNGTHAQLKELHQGHTDLTASVSAQLKGYDQAHAAMSRELRADLAKVAPDLRQTEAQRERESQQEIAQRKSDVNAQLKGYDQAHAAMSRQQRADLAKGHADLRTSGSALLQELHQGHTDLTNSVNTQLKGYQDEQAGAREEWRRMAATMAAKRTGTTAVAERPAPTAAPAEEAAEEGTEEGDAKSGELGNGDLVDQVFAHLAEHPDGTRLTALESEFGVSRFEMARLVRELTDGGKVEKRDFLYFTM